MGSAIDVNILLHASDRESPFSLSAHVGVHFLPASDMIPRL